MSIFSDEGRANLCVLLEEIKHFCWKVAHAPARKQWLALTQFQENLRDFGREHLLCDSDLSDLRVNELIRLNCACVHEFERYLSKWPRPRLFPMQDCEHLARKLAHAVEKHLQEPNRDGLTVNVKG